MHKVRFQLPMEWLISRKVPHRLQSQLFVGTNDTHRFYRGPQKRRYSVLNERTWPSNQPFALARLRRRLTEARLCLGSCARDFTSAVSQELTQILRCLRKSMTAAVFLPVESIMNVLPSFWAPHAVRGPDCSGQINTCSMFLLDPRQNGFVLAPSLVKLWSQVEYQIQRDGSYLAAAGAILRDINDRRFRATVWSRCLAYDKAQNWPYASHAGTGAQQRCSRRYLHRN